MTSKIQNSGDKTVTAQGPDFLSLQRVAEQAQRDERHTATVHEATRQSRKAARQRNK